MAQRYRYLKALFLLALVLGIASLGISVIRSMQKAKLASLEDGIAALQEETVPMRFMVLSRNGTTLSVRLKFYNLAGDEFAAMDTELEGEQLYLDFLAVPYGKTWIAFPDRVFTELVAPEAGLDLQPLVAPAMGPRTYTGGSLDGRALIEIGTLYSALQSGQPVHGAFGNAVHDIAQLGSFRVGQVYKIVIRKKGGLEILEE